MSYFEILLGAGISGITTLLLRLTLLNNASRVNQYINTINMLRADMLILKNEHKQTLESVNELKIRLLEKDKHVALLEASNWQTPFPYWLKDIFGVYIYVNEAFERANKLASASILGKSDIEIFGDVVGLEYDKTDKDLLDGNTAFIIYNDKNVHGNVIIKWKRTLGTTVIGIAGQSIPILNNIDK